MSNPFRLGQRVTFQAGGTWSRYQAWGEVVKVTPASVTVQPEHGREVVFRRGRDGRWPCEAMTDHERAMLAWVDTQPRGKYVTVLPNGLGQPHSGLVHREWHFRVNDQPLTGAACAAVEKELLKLARWIDAIPERPAK